MPAGTPPRRRGKRSRPPAPGPGPPLPLRPPPGVPAQRGVVPPGPIDLGEIRLGQSKPVPVTISNSGGLDLHISQIARAPFSSPDFSASAPPASIPPSQSFPLTLTFAPPAGGQSG